MIMGKMITNVHARKPCKLFILKKGCSNLNFQISLSGEYKYITRGRTRYNEPLNLEMVTSHKMILRIRTENKHIYHQLNE
jgi:hypothetical protein